MFDFLNRNKKKKTELQHKGQALPAEKLYATANGAFVKIEEIEDPVFSKKMMGDGFGVRPVDGEVYTPIAGTIMSVFPTKHAFYIKTDSGLEVLVHMGLDTVELEGTAFENKVAEGDRVAKGDLLSTVDLAALEQAGKGSTIVVVFTNMDQVEAVQLTADGQVSPGDEVGTITPAAQD